MNKAVRWTGDYFSLNNLLNLHENIEIIKNDNRYDVDVDLEGESVHVRLDEWVVVRGNKITAEKTKPTDCEILT